MRGVRQALKLLPVFQQQAASSLSAPAVSGAPSAVLQQARGLFTVPPHDTYSSSSSSQAVQQQQQLREQSTAAMPLFARGRTDAESPRIAARACFLTPSHVTCTRKLSSISALLQLCSTSPARAENQAIIKKGIKLLGTPMYLDMQATTPLDPRVVDAMLPFMTGQVSAEPY
eukprot:1157328-Pelagomonas_calceolata.AAC.9